MLRFCLSNLYLIKQAKRQQTGNKEEANRKQTGSKQETNRKLKGSKREANRIKQKAI